MSFDQYRRQLDGKMREDSLKSVRYNMWDEDDSEPEHKEVNPVERSIAPGHRFANTSRSTHDRTYSHSPSSAPSSSSSSWSSSSSSSPPSDLTAQKHMLIDHLGNNLSTLLEKAKSIGTELDVQNQELDNSGTQMTHTETRLSHIQAKASALIEASKQCCWPYGILIGFTISAVIFLLVLLYG